MIRRSQHQRRLGPWTDARPSRIQLTADGDWDGGWVIPAFQVVDEQVRWQPPKPAVDADQLRAILRQRHPTLLEPQTKPVAVEVAFDEPIPHWIGIDVSARDDAGFHRLDCGNAVRAAHPLMVTAGVRHT